MKSIFNQVQRRFSGVLSHCIIVQIISLAVFLIFPQNVSSQSKTTYLLPDGNEYVSWEVPVTYLKTYYVDNRNPNASDNNDGTQERPFLTISKAAEVLQPGERVVINSGVYREQIRPRRGGTAADKLISYEAAPGAKVIVKGSVVASKEKWQKSSGYRAGRGRSPEDQTVIYQYDLEEIDFKGYNPFGLVNLLHDDRSYFPWDNGRVQIKPHFLRRGMIFVDGNKLKQVEFYSELSANESAFWVEENGLTVHVRLKDNANPANHETEFVIREHVFAPKERFLGYIRVKGITFEHGASGFPIPQKGLVSTNRGNHWIIEDCVIRHANSLGLDIGGETWIADRPATAVGSHIIRRTHIDDAGVCGIAGVNAVNTLIESCMIENIGWHSVERTWESAGIKIHGTRNNVIANSVIRNVTSGPGIWFDYECNNSRITNNLIMNISFTVRGGIYIEASPKSGNMADHNIIWGITNAAPRDLNEDGGNGIIVDGSDEGIYAHNLIGMCENSGIMTRNAEWRVVAGGGGTSRWNRVENNIFYNCTKAIDFSSRDNFAEGNLYGRRGNMGAMRNRIFYPEKLEPDVVAWQRYFGFDKTGGYINLDLKVNMDEMTLSWSSEGEVVNVATGTHYKTDYFKKTAAKNRKAGPFVSFPENKTTISIDPRILR